MVSVKELIREKNAKREQLPSAGQSNKDMKKIKTTENLVVNKEEQMKTPVVQKEEEMTMASSVKRLIREKEAMREAKQSVKDIKEERREKGSKWKVERLREPSTEQEKDTNRVLKVEGDTTAMVNMKRLIREREEREAARERLLSAEKKEMTTKTQTKMVKTEKIKDTTTEKKRTEGELTPKCNIKQLIRDKEAMIMNETKTTGETLQRIRVRRMVLRNKREEERLSLTQTAEHKDDMTMEKKEEITATANVKQLIKRKAMVEEFPELRAIERNVPTLQQTIKYNVKQLIRDREAIEEERAKNEMTGIRDERREERLFLRIERRGLRLQRLPVEQNKEMNKLKETETTEEGMKTAVSVKQRIREKEPLTNSVASAKQGISDDMKKDRREKKILKWLPAEQTSDRSKTKSTTECRLLRMEEEMTEMSNVKQLVRQREAKRLAAAQEKQRMKNEDRKAKKIFQRLEDKVKDIIQKREERNRQLILAKQNMDGELETKMETTENALKTESTVATVQPTGEGEATAEQLLSEDSKSEMKTTEDDSLRTEDKNKDIKGESREELGKLEERFDLISVERHKDTKTTETIEEMTIRVNVIMEEEAGTKQLSEEMESATLPSSAEQEEEDILNEMRTGDNSVKMKERMKDLKEERREEAVELEERPVSSVIKMDEEIETKETEQSIEKMGALIKRPIETTEAIETLTERPVEEIETLTEQPVEDIETLITQPIEEMDTLVKQPSKCPYPLTEQPTEEKAEQQAEQLRTAEQLIEKKEKLTEPPSEEIETLIKQPIEEMGTLRKQPIDEIEKLKEQLIEEKAKELLIAEQNNEDTKDQMQTTEDKRLEMEGNIADVREEEEVSKQEDVEISDIKAGQREETLQLITVEWKDVDMMTEQSVLEMEQQMKHIKEDQRDEKGTWLEESLEPISSAEHYDYMSTMETPEDCVLRMKTLEDFVLEMLRTPEDDDLKWQEEITTNVNLTVPFSAGQDDSTVEMEEMFKDLQESSEEDLKELEMEQEMRAVGSMVQLIREGEAMAELLLTAEQNIRGLKDSERTADQCPRVEDNIEDIEKEMREMGDRWEERLQLLTDEHSTYMDRIKTTGKEVLEMQEEMTMIVNLAQKIREQEARAELWISKGLKNLMKEAGDGVLTEEKIKDIEEEEEVCLQQQVIIEMEATKEFLEKEETPMMVKVIEEQNAETKENQAPEKEETSAIVNVIRAEEDESLQHQVIREKEERTESKNLEKSKQLEKEQTSMEGNTWEETVVSSVIKVEEEILTKQDKETLTKQPMEEIKILIKQPSEERERQTEKPIEEMETLIEPIEEEKGETKENQVLEMEDTIPVNRLDVPHQNWELESLQQQVIKERDKEGEETKENQVLEREEMSMILNGVGPITGHEAMTEQEDKNISAEQTDDLTDVKTSEEHKLLNINDDLGEAIQLDEDWTTQFCQLTLDPNTVNNNLYLSEDNRKLTNVREEQPYPYHPERFDCASQVLCRQGLTGCCYWEVEWSEQASIAVAYSGITRTGHNDDCLLGYNEMSWSLDCYEVRKSSYEGLQGNRYIVRHNGNTTVVPDGITVSNRVGVYLDWSAGILSFYSVSQDTRTHLYTFQTTFTEALYCAFWCWMLDASVTLCQIEQ